MPKEYIMGRYDLRLSRFSLNPNGGRDFVVGDIHGFFNLLEELLKEVGFDKSKDRLFAVGDLIDRGPQSHKVLEYLGQPWFFSSKGNHEEMVKEYHQQESWLNSYARHGGQWFIDLHEYEKDAFVDALDKLPHIIEIDTFNGKFGLVHAEVPTNDWEMFKIYYDKFGENSLWSFDIFNDFQKEIRGLEMTKELERGILHVNVEALPITGIDYVVHGHVSVMYPTQIENVIYLDTGAISRKLSLLEINNPEGLIAY
jgi:serine/threonine protein phosphatase 1